MNLQRHTSLLDQSPSPAIAQKKLSVMDIRNGPVSPKLIFNKSQSLPRRALSPPARFPSSPQVISPKSSRSLSSTPSPYAHQNAGSPSEDVILRHPDHQPFQRSGLRSSISSTRSDSAVQRKAVSFGNAVHYEFNDSHLAKQNVPQNTSNIAYGRYSLNNPNPNQKSTARFNETSSKIEGQLTSPVVKHVPVKNGVLSGAPQMNNYGNGRIARPENTMALNERHDPNPKSAGIGAQYQSQRPGLKLHHEYAPIVPIKPETHLASVGSNGLFSPVTPSPSKSTDDNVFQEGMCISSFFFSFVFVI